MTGGEPVRILLVSGSLRAESANAAVLRTLQALAPAGVETTIYEGLARLPHFNPDDDFEPLPGPVRGLRAQVEAASAVLFCTPEYASAVPGSFKIDSGGLIGHQDIRTALRQAIDALVVHVARV